MAKKRRIVFIGHDSSLTGAPVYLLNLIELLVKRNNFDIKLVLARGGPLENQYKNLVSTIVLKPAHYSTDRGFIKRLVNYLNYQRQLLKAKRTLASADLLFSNTVANGRLLKRLYNGKCTVITCVHELESVIAFHNQFKDSTYSLSISHFFACPTKAVADNLILNHRVDLSNTGLLPFFIKKEPSSINEDPDVYKHRFLTKHQIPGGKFYVAGMGTATHRKGIDLFLEVCKIVAGIDKTICFVWIGGFEESSTQEFVSEFVRMNKLENCFFLTGRIPHASYNLLPFDLFFLSSREDPYPLVVLEAALLKIPALYFADAGGINEFAGADGGWPIESFNTTEAADLIITLKNERELISGKGEVAYSRVLRVHGNEDIIAATFEQLVEKAIGFNKKNLA